MQRRIDLKERDVAAYPVIGVMLMLVVTIIIAAVISGFAGGLVTSQEPAPSASFDVSLTDDSLSLAVQSISEPIPSKNIMIVLSNGTHTRKLVPGVPNSTVPFGFNIVEEGSQGFKDSYNVSVANENPAISRTQAANSSNSMQWFGNYTLKTGSRMSASGDAFMDVCSSSDAIPAGFTKDSFTKGEICEWTKDQWVSVFGSTLTDVDQGSASNVLKLGKNQQITDDDLKTYLGSYVDGDGKFKGDVWATALDAKWSFGQTSVYGSGHGSISLSPGDRVTVTIVHTPSGQTMFTKTVTVKGA